MDPYRRPAIEPRTFLDVAGHPIDYGHRWDGSPPEETYSVDSHPERFAPLHAVADALVTFLHEQFEVVVEDVVGAARDPRHEDIEAVRFVEVRPSRPSCAPLTFVFTAYPGVRLHAGLLHVFSYPVCGCDACDETWDTQADLLEQHVRAIVSGGFRETVTDSADLPLEYSMNHRGGSESGAGRLSDDLPWDAVRAAQAVLRALPAGWEPWPRRD